MLPVNERIVSCRRTPNERSHEQRRCQQVAWESNATPFGPAVAMRRPGEGSAEDRRRAHQRISKAHHQTVRADRFDFGHWIGRCARARVSAYLLHRSTDRHRCRDPRRRRRQMPVHGARGPTSLLVELADIRQRCPAPFLDATRRARNTWMTASAPRRAGHDQCGTRREISIFTSRRRNRNVLDAAICDRRANVIRRGNAFTTSGLGGVMTRPNCGVRLCWGTAESRSRA